MRLKPESRTRIARACGEKFASRLEDKLAALDRQLRSDGNKDEGRVTPASPYVEDILRLATHRPRYPIEEHR